MSDPVDGTPVVLTEDLGAVRVLTLNRPDHRNAIDMTLRVALAEALEAADRAPSVRAIVVTGAGPAFSAGGDVATMERQSAEAARPRAEAAQRVIRAIWTTAKPVVAGVDGPAYGAGASIALACDRVVASETAAFSMAFSGVGLAGDMGIFVSLPARVGVARARQMLMLPERIAADQALSLGLADRLVPSDARTAAIEDARQLAAGPALALGVIKTMLAHPVTDPIEALAREVDQQVALFDSDDFAEGVSAFRDKRRPNFGDRPVTGSAASPAGIR